MIWPDEAMKKKLHALLGDRLYGEWWRAEIRRIVAVGAGRVLAIDAAACARVEAMVLSAPPAPEPKAPPAPAPERDVEPGVVRAEDDDDAREGRRGPRLSLVDMRF